VALYLLERSWNVRANMEGGEGAGGGCVVGVGGRAAKLEAALAR